MQTFKIKLDGKYSLLVTRDAQRAARYGEVIGECEGLKKGETINRETGEIEQIPEPEQEPPLSQEELKAFRKWWKLNKPVGPSLPPPLPSGGLSK